MSALFCYLAGSLILLVGGVITNAPTFFIVASGLFVLGSLIAIATGNK